MCLLVTCNERYGDENMHYRAKIHRISSLEIHYKESCDSESMKTLQKKAEHDCQEIFKDNIVECTFLIFIACK